MNIERSYWWFTEMFKISNPSNGWYRFKNPFFNKGDKTMAVNFEYNFVKCFRTGYGETIQKFMMDFLNIDYRDVIELLNEYDDHKEIKTENIKYNPNLPKSFKTLFADDHVLTIRARKYLTDRGFNVEYLDQRGFGYCSEGEFFGRIIIPIISRGKLIYYIGRSIIGETPKYKNAPRDQFNLGISDIFFNQDAVDLYSEVNIVEGVFDALTLGNNSIAHLHSKLSTKQIHRLITSQVTRFNFFPDSGYYVHVLKLALDLIKYKEVRVIDTRYFNTGNDVNDWGKEPVLHLLKETKPLTIQNALIQINNATRSINTY